MEKNKYESPEIEIISYESVDVITASNIDPYGSDIFSDNE